MAKNQQTEGSVGEVGLAGIPVIVRDGFNYGYRYPYVNAMTGVYANETTFSETVEDVLARYSTFSPREWIMANMTPQHATETLQRAIQHVGSRIGEAWTRDLVVKTSLLNSQSYWDSDDKERFRGDYAYLESCIRR